MIARPRLLDPALLAFNQLPSRSLHPSRHADYLGDCSFDIPTAGEPWDPIWHRHWSRAILEKLGLRDRPVIDPTLPSLPLALLPTDRLAQCMRSIGALLCGPRLRRAISGPEVRAMLATLGTEVVDFIRRDGVALHPGMDESNDWAMNDTLDAVEILGRGALLAAFREDGPEVALRAELKLPAGPTAEAPMAGAQALALALDIVSIKGATWHSS